MSEIQENRLMSVTTALEDDELLFHSMHGTEEIGRLYEFEVDLLSEKVDIKFEDLLGEPMSVQLEQSDGEVRHFSGYVSKFSQVGSLGNYALYRASVRPWLWFLTRTSNCRIFQSKTVPEIISEIFGEHPFADHEDALSETYRQWDYCVQYRESDLNFISRLMEQEGIYYYFKHKEGKNTLVLADSMSAHTTVPGYEDIPYFELNNMTAGDRETVTGWNMSMQVQPGVYATTDYDFEKPKASLMSKLMNPMEHSVSGSEIYDYPGEFVELADGERYARIRLEELQASHHRADGTTNARGMVPGALFTLENHLRQDQNKQYLVVSSRYSLQTSSYGTGGGGSWHYECAFSVASADVPFRSQRSTPKPLVQGPQTAIVVGPSGETIWPDKYGRVKVQFYWDREGTNDENSSCWMRVSQNRAGKNWGESYIPHVGQEVIVSFLEGDPDRPIITGRVYNTDNMPPIDLPGGKTKLAMRDQGGNEMVMEGEEGSQFIHIQQTCGNEIRMQADGPDIEIKQACGNEILMHDAEGIQIRDKFGNEIVLDSVAGTMKLRSPSHESVIELGNSIWWSTKSDVKEKVDGNAFSIIQGMKDDYVVGPVKFKYDGISAKVHGGLASDTFIGGQHSSLIGGKITLNASKEVTKNLLSRERQSAGYIKYDSAKFIWLVGGSGSNSEVWIDDDAAVINSGADERIDVTKGESVVIKSGKKIILDAPEIVLRATTITMDASSEISMPKAKVNSKNVNDDGT